MYKIIKSIDIDFAHHIRGHQGACINIHGHTWKFEVGVQAKELNEDGFVVDFSKLKKSVLMPCHQLLDHALAIGETSISEIGEFLSPMGEKLVATRADAKPTPDNWEFHGAKGVYPGGMKVAVFPFSPTSEKLARWLYDAASAELADDRVQISFARIYETLHPVQAVAEYWPE